MHRCPNVYEHFEEQTVLLSQVMHRCPNVYEHFEVHDVLLPQVMCSCPNVALESDFSGLGFMLKPRPAFQCHLTETMPACPILYCNTIQCNTTDVTLANYMHISHIAVQ